ncbi:MAG: hypothetical protein JST11_20675 [Acidobacteria bacterium]|nr:hypothetical protein [Acidobacteriota bacterium]
MKAENCLAWNCAGVTDPTLVLNTDGSVSAWFVTIGIRMSSGTYVADGPYIGRSIGVPGGSMAYSPELPVAPTGAAGTWDRYLETPTVRRNPDSTLTMWYTGHPNFNVSNTAIGQMVSTDAQGTTWIRGSAPIYTPAPGAWDGSLACGPTVVKGPDGTWYLYYTGAGTTGAEGVGLLTSTDGAHWTRYGNGPVLAAQPGAWDSEILEQSAIYFQGQFWMWYSAYRGPLDMKTTPISIGLATSPDGIHWTRYTNNPVIGPGAPGTWDDLRVLAPDVAVQPDGSLLMIAYGASKTDLTGGSIGFWRSLP